MLECHLECVRLGNLLSHIVPLVLHRGLEHIPKHLGVLKGRLEGGIRLLEPVLQVIHLLDHHLDIRHLCYFHGPNV